MCVAQSFSELHDEIGYSMCYLLNCNTCFCLAWNRLYQLFCFRASPHQNMVSEIHVPCAFPTPRLKYTALAVCS